MANAIYPKGKEALLSGLVNIPSDTIKVVLVTSGYTYSAAHQYYSDISTNHIGTDQTLGSKTVTSGVFNAGNPTWTAVTAGSTVSAFIIYKDTGTPSTSPLILFDDTVTAGLPLTTNGGNVALTFDTGASKIFAL